MAGAKYIMVNIGKIMKGDLALLYVIHGGRRWRKVDDLALVGKSIHRCGFLVKRPLENIK